MKQQHRWKTLETSTRLNILENYITTCNHSLSPFDRIAKANRTKYPKHNHNAPEKCTRTKYSPMTWSSSANSNNTYPRAQKRAGCRTFRIRIFHTRNAVQFLRKVFYDRSTDPRDAHLMHRKMLWKHKAVPRSEIKAEKIYMRNEKNICIFVNVGYHNRKSLSFI